MSVNPFTDDPVAKISRAATYPILENGEVAEREPVNGVWYAGFNRGTDEPVAIAMYCDGGYGPTWGGSFSNEGDHVYMDDCDYLVRQS